MEKLQVHLIVELLHKEIEAGRATKMLNDGQIWLMLRAANALLSLQRDLDQATAK